MSVITKESHVPAVEFTEEKKALLKKTLCKSLTSENELELFLHTCTRLGLDPFMKQIYAVKRGDTMTIQTGIDGYRLIAERSGKYMPGREPTFTYKDNQLFSATSYVKKLGPDHQWHEIACTAIYSEYAPVYQGKVSGMWKDKGHLMLAKCAESAALRRAFPAEMSGVYTDEEMDQADNHNVNRHTGESNKSVETGSKPVVEIDEPRMGMQHDLELMELIGDDIEYRNRIFTGYTKTLGREVKSFLDIPVKHYEKIKEAVVAYMEAK
jgi:phage recombination protein Bet